MDFKKQADEERAALAIDRTNVYQAITSFISAAVPMNNKLKSKTDAQLTALFPNKAADAMAVRDWLLENAVSMKASLETFKALLEP